MRTGLLLLAAEVAGGKAAPSAGGNIVSLIFPLVIIFFIFYWLMIRPQRKAEQQRREMISALSKGDKIVTIGGIYGQVTDIDEKSVKVMVDQSKGVEMKFLKEAVRGVERKKENNQ